VGSLKVTFVEVDGAEKVVEDAQAGESLMTIARAHNVDGILGDCGGSCSCATCHVYVDPAWQAQVGAADEIELSVLDMVSDVHKPNSRLCCQIVLREELNGIRVTVAPNP
jgi:2Fe-2S ferredoxin